WRNGIWIGQGLKRFNHWNQNSGTLAPTFRSVDYPKLTSIYDSDGCFDLEDSGRTLLMRNSKHTGACIHGGVLMPGLSKR
ncbi:Hypothetical predicted protein, partial [Marmota monax]